MPRFISESVKIALPLIVIAAGIAAFAAIGQRQPAPTNENNGQNLPLVDTVTVDKFAGEITVDVDGLVVPYREISLAAEVAGRITYKAEECRAGKFVTANTKLFEIDPEMYQLEIERLEAEKEQAKGNLQELHVQIENNNRLVELGKQTVALEQKKLKRARQLYDRGVATESDLDQAIQNELTTRNNLVTLQNQTSLSEKQVTRLEQAINVIDARLRQARRDLRHTTITAPIDGVIVSDTVELDGFVQNGTQLVVIEDTSKAEIRCNLKMDELGWLLDNPDNSTGDPANTPIPIYSLPEVPVTVSYQLGGHRYEWKGHVARFDGVGLDPKTRTIPCRIEVPHPETFRIDGQTLIERRRGLQTLMRGMFVHVQAHVWPKTALLQIPERALKPGNVVWREVDGAMQIVPAKAMWRENSKVLIAVAGSQLKPGDELIVSPLSNPIDGTKVQLRESQLQKNDTP